MALQAFETFELAQSVARMDDRAVCVRPHEKTGWLVVVKRDEVGDHCIGMNGTEGFIRWDTELAT